MDGLAIGRQTRSRTCPGAWRARRPIKARTAAASVDGVVEPARNREGKYVGRNNDQYRPGKIVGPGFVMHLNHWGLEPATNGL
jgi:hypothetical protein